VTEQSTGIDFCTFMKLLPLCGLQLIKIPQNLQASPFYLKGTRFLMESVFKNYVSSFLIFSSEGLLMQFKTWSSITNKLTATFLFLVLKYAVRKAQPFLCLCYHRWWHCCLRPNSVLDYNERREYMPLGE